MICDYKRLSYMSQQLITCILIASATVAGTARADNDDDPVVVANAVSALFIVVPVQLGTTQFSFVLDSGASHHAFDISLESYLGNRVSTAVANGTTSVSVFKMPAATICGIPVG